MFAGIQRSVLDHQLRVIRGLANLLASLTQTHTCLQLIVVDTVLADDEEVVFLVPLGRLALDVPVVFASHLVLVLLVVLVQHLVAKVTPSLLERRLRWQEVGNKLLATLVHHTPDHGLGHLLELRRYVLTHRSRVGVEDYLRARILPVIKVGEEREHLLGHHIRLAVVLNQFRFRVFERLFDGLDLAIAVHVQSLLPQALLHVIAHFRLHLLHVLRLEAGLLRGNVFTFAQPRHALCVVPGPHRVLWRVHILLEQALVGRIQLLVGRVGLLVQVPVDQVNGHAEVVLRQYFVLVVALQRRGIVLDEAVILERIRDELQIERDVGKTVRVLDAANQLGPEV